MKFVTIVLLILSGIFLESSLNNTKAWAENATPTNNTDRIQRSRAMIEHFSNFSPTKPGDLEFQKCLVSTKELLPHLLWDRFVVPLG